MIYKNYYFIKKIICVFSNTRKLQDTIFTYLLYLSFLFVFVPLLFIVWTVFSNGLKNLNINFILQSMKGINGLHDENSVNNHLPIFGGIYHAIIGTFLITLWSIIISVPLGLLTSIYLVEYNKNYFFARLITYFVDIMTGIPSIVAGLFSFSFFSFLFQSTEKSGFVGSIALSVIMIPLIIKSSEELLRTVPHELREASYALGATKWFTLLNVILPNTISGITSSITLAIARVIGETAPLIVASGFSTQTNFNIFSGWMTALPVYIYTQILNPTSPTYPEPSEQRAWSAALVLILCVITLNIIARLISYLLPNRKQ